MRAVGVSDRITLTAEIKWASFEAGFDAVLSVAMTIWLIVGDRHGGACRFADFILVWLRPFFAKHDVAEKARSG